MDFKSLSALVNKAISGSAKDYFVVDKSGTSLPQVNEQEVNKLNVTTQTAKSAETFIREKEEQIDAPPLYYKPAFFLEQYAPYIDVAVLLIDANNKSVAVPIFRDAANYHNNAITGMQLNTTGLSLTLNFRDIDEGMIETLMTRFALMGKSSLTGSEVTPIQLQITYGWVAPADLKRKLGNNIKFEETVLANLTKININYSSDDLYSGTIECVIDSSFPPPYHTFRPYKALGHNPATTINLIRIINMLNEKLGKYETNNADPSAALHDVSIIFFYYYDVRDKATLIILMKLIVKYFCSYDTTKYADAIEAYITNNWAAYSTPDLQNKSLTLLKTVAPAFNLSNDQPITTGDTPLTRIMQSTNKHSQLLKELRASGTSRGQANSKIKAFDSLMKTIAKIANEALIHPLDVYEYVQKQFGAFTNTFNTNISSDFSLHNTFITLVKLDEVQPKGAFSFDGTGIVRNDDLIKQLYTDRIQKEKWCQSAKNFSIQQNDGWQQYLSNITGKIYVRYQTTNVQLLNQLQRNEALRGDQTSTSAPVPLHTNSFKTTKAQAIKNLERMNLLQSEKLKRNPNNNLGTNDPVLKAINEELKNIKESKHEHILMFITDAMPSETIFGADVDKQHILQAYSYRGASERKKYNPGFPTVWDINFPDILEFSVTEMNFQTMVDSIVIQEQSGINESVGANISATDERQILSNKIILLAHKLQQTPNTEANTVSRTSTISEVNDLLAQYRSQEELHGNGNKSTGAMPNKQPQSINLDFTKRDQNSGTFADMLTKKRELQEFRRKLTRHAMQIKVNLKVIGDPSFQASEVGKYIFIKYTKSDGMLGMYTGLYLIKNIIHEFSSGNFTTSLELSYFPQDGTKVAKKMEELWTHQDNIVLNTYHVD